MFTKKVLSKVREFILEAEEVDRDAICTGFQIDPEDFDSLMSELAAAYPGEFNNDEEEDEPAGVAHKLIDSNNIAQDLEVVKRSETVVVFRLKKPKDLVDVIVRGMQVTVDLIELRTLNPSEVKYGVTIARLIEMAELAKA